MARKRKSTAPKQSTFRPGRYPTKPVTRRDRVATIHATVRHPGATMKSALLRTAAPSLFYSKFGKFTRRVKNIRKKVASPIGYLAYRAALSAIPDPKRKGCAAKRTAQRQAIFRGGHSGINGRRIYAKHRKCK